MDDPAADAYLTEEGADRGRGAEAPHQVPPRGLKDVVVRVMRQVKVDNVPLLAAGVAFFALLALVPSLVALVSVYGLVAEPATVERQITSVTDALPEEAAGLLTDQMRSVAQSSGGGLGLGVVVGDSHQRHQPDSDTTDDVTLDGDRSVDLLITKVDAR